MDKTWTVTLVTTNNTYVKDADALYLVGAMLMELAEYAQNEEAENYLHIVEMHIA